jgi:pimeloyl-ACP methyl ester carboxylesterase
VGPLPAELGRVDAFTLSPPGFGVPAPEGFESTVDGYRDWLVARLEQFGRPVDLVGHDWGGAHVMQVAMRRPDLIRSWASDALGVFAPDFVWHPMAQVWQQEGVGEESVKELFGGSFEERRAVVIRLGMAGDVAERIAAGMDDGMGRAVLTLLRSAAQPAMAEAGRGLADARRRRGLALLAMRDVGIDGSHAPKSSTVPRPRPPAPRSPSSLTSGTGGRSRTRARPLLRSPPSGPVSTGHER